MIIELKRFKFEKPGRFKFEKFQKWLKFENFFLKCEMVPVSFNVEHVSNERS